MAVAACQNSTAPRPDPPPQNGSSLPGLEKIDRYNVDLGIFNSNVLKISWFRYAQIVGEVQVEGKRMVKTVRWEPQWFAIFSHSWLRNRGATAEKYLEHVRDLKLVYSQYGFPDMDVQRMVKYLILSAGLKDVPDAGSTLLNREWFDRMQRMPISQESWDREVGLAKILVVESDKGCRTMVHYSVRDDPALMTQSKALHTEAARLMAAFVPDAGGMRVDPEK